MAASLCACACSSSTSEPSTGAGGAQATPAAVHFSGTYQVPAPPNLAAAALYPVEGIKWSVAGQSAVLDYDLPKELVGSTLRVTFAGSVDAAGSAQLTGEVGTADCTVSAAEVVCHEVMRGLLPLEPDVDAVERLAAKTYAGAEQDRVDVARLFSTDPIGIVTIDLSSGKADDDTLP